MVNLSKTVKNVAEEGGDTLNPASVNNVAVDENSAGQRVDNFLTRLLRGVPKSHIYRIVRSGEVRVNSKRVEASHKLAVDDQVRIPPVRTAVKPAMQSAGPVSARLEHTILFEDEALLVINKPAGLAVHGGSGISRGVIEQFRLERPQAKFLELVHRLDRETSGILLLAKKRAALVALHEAIRNNQTDKRYLILVHGVWPDQKKRVTMPLQKYVLPSGERRVSVQPDGQHSETVFHLRQQFAEFSLLEAQLVTGRTHQLRVQLAHLGFPIAGDDKYGDFAVNKQMQQRGLKRMFLHSADTSLKHPISGEKLRLAAPLPAELDQFLQKLKAGKA
ncbi:RluA family pseudouridine synthase [Pseudomethylobacillus aquaticus]|uniref:Pseudouridine synthase n=1 Tax=Pseudomethylobacillus aquaticus TaxID=2676064 RepID=A0A3N0V6E9_9PROT|nr:RluA family pseudouridine synthase [Pseudomethylobacillus aquaticus]ROH88255.1 RluA family pseudouridine synthase [Pseudomethylobacillus aquaticus]